MRKDSHECLHEGEMSHPHFNDKGVICLNFFASLNMWKVVLKWLLTIFKLMWLLYIPCTFKISFRKVWMKRLVTLSRFFVECYHFPKCYYCQWEGFRAGTASSIVVTHCLLKWMCSEIYDVLAYNLFYQQKLKVPLNF